MLQDIERILKTVNKMYGSSITIDQIYTHNRMTKSNTLVKHLTIYLLNIVLGYKVYDIIKELSTSNQTVIYILHKIEDMRDDPEFDESVTHLERIVQNG